jgi:hypothetical protein
MFSHASTPVAAAGTATAASPLWQSSTRCKQALTLIKRKQQQLQQQQRLNTSLNSSPTAAKFSNEHHHSGYSNNTAAAPVAAATTVAGGTVPHAVSVDIAAAWLKSAMSITVKDPKSLLRGPAHEFRDGTLLGR